MSEDIWKDATTVKPIRLYDGSNEEKAVTLFFDCMTEDNQEINATITLIQKDGTMREKAFKAAAAILGCSPADFPWERVDGTDESTVGLPVSVVQNGNFWNCHPRGEKKASIDPTDMKAKYGAKLRALFGGSSAGSVPKAHQTQPRTSQTAPPPPPSQPPPAPQTSKYGNLQIATMQEAWQSFVEAYKTQKGADSLLNENWFKCITAVTDKKQTDCVAEDWGAIKAAARTWILNNVTPF